jgi:hypothetical protein
MAIKRYAEYRFINSAELAGLYRRSFRYYTEESLLASAFFTPFVRRSSWVSFSSNTASSSY